MVKYKRRGAGFIDNETGTYTPTIPGNRHYQEVMDWIAAGNTPDPEHTSEELVILSLEHQKELIKNAFKHIVSQPTECVAGGKMYQMDANYDAAVRMNNGITLAQKLGQTTMDIVDFHNVVHAGVSIEDAESIMLQQAVAWSTAWSQKAKAISALLTN